MQKTGHNPDTDNIKVLCREDWLIARKVRKAICIKNETNPTLNRDGGAWTYKSLWFPSGDTKIKDVTCIRFQKRISQSQFSLLPLRTVKGITQICGSKMWVLLISFNLFFMSSADRYKNIHSPKNNKNNKFANMWENASTRTPQDPPRRAF